MILINLILICYYVSKLNSNLNRDLKKLNGSGLNFNLKYPNLNQIGRVWIFKKPNRSNPLSSLVVEMATNLAQGHG